MNFTYNFIYLAIRFMVFDNPVSRKVAEDPHSIHITEIKNREMSMFSCNLGTFSRL